jgi:long-subunit acyl-CoA synthetase (AMP-forming)
MQFMPEQLVQLYGVDFGILNWQKKKCCQHPEIIGLILKNNYQKVTGIPKRMQILESEKKLGEVIPNLAQMLQKNAANLGNYAVYKEQTGNTYQGISWSEFYNNLLNIGANLKEYGFNAGDKMVIFSRNRLEMLELELAVMASGGIAVPIFANYNQETAELLISHSDARFLAVSGEQQLRNISPNLPVEYIFIFDNIHSNYFANLIPFNELLKTNTESELNLKFDAAPEDICLNMYTSGTTGTPKCVQLTHQNILSQRTAMDQLWDIDENDRFLSYLPWHHSFGGIYELFTALYNGATLHLESGYGKDPKVILENWKLVQPTVFFSVPVVYQALFDLTKENSEAEKVFFHPELKFIFTAAAPLSERLSLEFERRDIPVLEGWGLTETSPCCTITDPKLKREPRIVGKPIPGVSIRIDAMNEIQVKGPNVMVGYYKNEEANKDIFTEDGWFRTGDVGEITPQGLKLITRKDRIFKLSNGEKVVPTELEALIQKKCHYVSYALVEGSGKEYPVALLFPNYGLLGHSDPNNPLIEGCVCPRSLEELSKCLHGCLNDANCGIGQEFAKIKSAVLIDDELSLDKQTLTPSMKVVPKRVLNVYKAHLENLYDENEPVKEKVYIIKLD